MSKPMRDESYNDRRATIQFVLIVLGAIVTLLTSTGTVWAEEAVTINKRARSNKYFGFGIGGGAGLENHSGSPFQDMKSGGAVSIRYGRRISPDLLCGIDINFWGHKFDTSSGERTYLFTFVDLTLSYYPIDDLGWYLKGGAGVADRFIFGKDLDDKKYHSFGLGLRAATGYEVKLGEKFHLGLEIASATSVLPRGISQDFVSQVTLNWY